MKQTLFLFIWISAFWVACPTWANNALENQDKSFQKATELTQEHKKQLQTLLPNYTPKKTTSP